MFAGLEVVVVAEEGVRGRGEQWEGSDDEEGGVVGS